MRRVKTKFEKTLERESRSQNSGKYIIIRCVVLWIDDIDNARSDLDIVIHWELE